MDLKTLLIAYKIWIITPIITIILVISMYVFYTKPKKIKNLRQEVVMFQLLKDAVLDKYVPDSIKQATRDASYTLMFADEGNNDYWKSKETLRQTKEYISKCKPCVYVDSLLQMKTTELEKLSK